MARVSKKKAVAKRTKSTAVTNIQEQIRAEAEGIAETVTSSGGSMIKLDQKNGTFLEIPGVGQAELPMDIVILDYISRNFYYPGRFDSNNITPPECFAIGKKPKDLKPSPNVIDKQSELCSGCPNNEFESDPMGGRGKACKNTRLLAILPPDADSEAEIMTLSVSPTGLKNFDTYVTAVAAKFGTIPVGVVTEINSMEVGQGYTLTFSNPRPNPNLEANFARKAEAQAMLEAEPDMSQRATTQAAPKRTTKKRAARR